MRAAFTETCWPRIVRTAVSNGSHAPGTRSPGRRATSGARRGSAERWAAIGPGIGVEVEEAPRAASRLERRGRSEARQAEGERPARLVEARLDDARRSRRAPRSAGRRRPRPPRRPGTARVARNARRAASSNGGRNGSLRTIPTGVGAAVVDRLSSVGGTPNAARIASLKRLTLEKPAASATSDIRSDVSSRSLRAKWTRLVRATATGEAPRCSAKRRLRCRSPTPRRLARTPSGASSATPASICRRARATVVDVPVQAGVPGAVSGRQRRQARKPASSAAAAQRKKRTFRGFGRGAGQPGRQ